MGMGLLQQSQKLQAPGAKFQETPSDVLSRLCAYVDPPGCGYATALRQRSGGETKTFDTGDSLSDSLLMLAQDYYPCLLLPASERDPFSFNPFPLTLSRLSFDHPLIDCILTALGDEEPLRKLFPSGEISKETATKQAISRSGRGGASQAGFLPSTFLINAEPRAWLSGELSLESYLNAVTAELAAARALAEENEVMVPVTVGFRSVQVPDEFELKTPWGVLRRPNPWQRRWAPAEADVVLEVDFPMAAHIPDEDFDAAFRALASEFFAPLTELEGEINKMRLALLLGSASEPPVSLAPTWRFIPDPLQAPGFSWWSGEARMTAGEINSGDVEELESWMKTVEERFDSKLDLATRRLLSSVTQRMNAEDGLIDATVALESLFGTGQGEIRFRLSVAIAWLLESDPEARERRRRQVSSIYDDRSKVVHGGHLAPERAEEARNEAIAVAISAMGTLISDRPELIADESRGRTLAIAG